MAAIDGKQLVEAMHFNSGPSGLGTDYWVVYTHRSDPTLIVVNCSGVAVGWEFDRWEAAQLDDATRPIWEQLRKARGDARRCELVQKLPRKPVDVVGR